jgi:hypothetical protein
MPPVGIVHDETVRRYARKTKEAGSGETSFAGLIGPKPKGALPTERHNELRK